jgi:hypothetical protein
MLNEASPKSVSSFILSSVYFIIIYSKGTMNLPLKPDEQWPRIVAKYNENVVKLLFNPDRQ